MITTLTDSAPPAATDGVCLAHPICATEFDDLRRDSYLDRLAGIAPECLGDLLELADRVIEVAA